jgi:hypothetical protein
VSSASSLTQTVATAALAGVVALAGTNLEAQGPVDAFKQHYTTRNESISDDVLANIAGMVSIPTRVSRFPDLDRTRSDSRWQKYVYQRILELRNGEDDFTELPRPAPLVTDRAWQVATRVLRPDTPTPSVVPSDEGNVVFVWHKARWDLEIEVGPEEATVWAHNQNTGEMFSGSLDVQLEKVSSLLDFLAWH